MKAVAGLTLLEVLIALVVLAVGVLMAAAMQTSALRASGDAAALQGVTRVAENEIAFRRQIGYGDATTDTGADRGPACLTAPPEGYECRVDMRYCALLGAALSCSVGAAPRDADQITVTVGGPRGKTITLRTVKAR